MNRQCCVGRGANVSTTRHSYGDLNRLTEADGGTDLSYGADGPLDSLHGTARRFSYDTRPGPGTGGANITAERNSAGAMAYRYVHAGGLGAPLMRYSGTGTSTREFYLTDERGSVIAAAGDLHPLAPTFMVRVYRKL